MANFREPPVVCNPECWHVKTGFNIICVFVIPKGGSADDCHPHEALCWCNTRQKKTPAWTTASYLTRQGGLNPGLKVFQYKINQLWPKPFIFLNSAFTSDEFLFFFFFFGECWGALLVHFGEGLSETYTTMCLVCMLPLGCHCCWKGVLFWYDKDLKTCFSMTLLTLFHIACTSVALGIKVSSFIWWYGHGIG